MGGRRPAGAERVEVPESNTLLLMPRSSLMAAVRDRITGANGLIPSNGFPLGQQLETVKAGHLPPQLTRRGIDQKKCKLLSTRRTPRLWSASVPGQRIRHIEGVSSAHGVSDVPGYKYNRFYGHPSLLRSPTRDDSLQEVPRSAVRDEQAVSVSPKGVRIRTTSRRSLSHMLRARDANVYWAA